LHATFETKDSMGANFINSCLEQFAKTLKDEAINYPLFQTVKRNSGNHEHSFQLCKLPRSRRSFLSNSRLTRKHIDNPLDFAQRFVQAVQIAEVEPLEL
jgi:hydroxymethylglutaryl-CoA reductase